MQKLRQCRRRSLHGSTPPLYRGESLPGAPTRLTADVIAALAERLQRQQLLHLQRRQRTVRAVARQRNLSRPTWPTRHHPPGAWGRANAPGPWYGQPSGSVSMERGFWTGASVRRRPELLSFGAVGHVLQAPVVEHSGLTHRDVVFGDCEAGIEPDSCASLWEPCAQRLLDGLSRFLSGICCSIWFVARIEDQDHLQRVWVALGPFDALALVNVEVRE